MVQAKVRYINSEWRGKVELPRIGSRDTRRANTSFQPVAVQDARGRLADGSLSLDTSGFILASHAPVSVDYRDADEVRERYQPQMVSLVLSLTGAEQGFVTHYQVRTETPTSFNDAYARFVHCDYNQDDASSMAANLLKKNGVEPGANWQYAWYNTWQPVDREVQTNPLAMIDSATLADEDVIGYRYTGYGGDGLSAAPVYNTAHQWFYFPAMAVDEVLVLKQLDTRPDRASLCPHTSFDDPESAADALPRRSIETRIMAVFEGA